MNVAICVNNIDFNIYKYLGHEAKISKEQKRLCDL